MDGSAAVGLAQEITITTRGLLLLLGGVTAIVTGVLIYHLRDCSGHRNTFHTADRRMERKVENLMTNVAWLIRLQGHEPIPMPPEEGDRGEERGNLLS